MVLMRLKMFALVAAALLVMMDGPSTAATTFLDEEEEVQNKFEGAIIAQI